MEDERELSFGEFLDDIRSIIVSPGRRFPVIHERGALWGSLFLLIAPGYFAFSYLGGIYFDREPFPGYSLLIPAVAAGLSAYVKIFCIHLVARLFEGKGRYFAATGRLRDLFVVIGYADVPSIIALLLAFSVFTVIPGQVGYLFHHSHTLAMIAFISLGIALFVWNLILAVLALRSVYPMRDIKIVAAVILGSALFALPALSLHLVVGEASVDMAYLAPDLNENLLRLFAPDPSQESRPARIDVHVDRLAYKFKQPKRFDLAIFDPEHTLPGKGAQKQGGVVVGRVGVISGEKKDKAAGRIIGLPGERIEIVQGKLYINGQLWVEPYIAPQWESTASLALRTLAPAQFLILPDDRHLLGSGYSDVVVNRDAIAGRMCITKYPLGWWLFQPTVFLKGHPALSAATP